MAWLKNIIVTFSYVLAGSVICAMVFIALFWPESEEKLTILWEVVVLSIFGSVGNLIFYSRHEMSKKKMKVRTVIHYIYIYAAVLSCAHLFGWIVPGNIRQLIVMIIMISCVTLSVGYAVKKKEARTAELINRKLSRMNLRKDENEENENKDRI
ncbi:MAG TPA: DUF3021 domain-containing protein [Clostridiales bacterium]|nr:DUF3021 domain-containing protein [Clostridiales bacterium]